MSTETETYIQVLDALRQEIAETEVPSKSV